MVIIITLLDRHTGLHNININSHKRKLQRPSKYNNMEAEEFCDNPSKPTEKPKHKSTPLSQFIVIRSDTVHK